MILDVDVGSHKFSLFISWVRWLQSFCRCKKQRRSHLFLTLNFIPRTSLLYMSKALTAQTIKYEKRNVCTFYIRYMHNMWILFETTFFYQAKILRSTFQYEGSLRISFCGKIHYYMRKTLHAYSVYILG